MATSFAKLDIMNTALITQGQYEITENDGSDEFRLLSKNWPSIVEAELEDGNYYFTRQQAELLSRTDGKYGFDDAYIVPGTALHVRQVWVEDERGERSFPDWAQDDARIYTNAPDGIFCEYLICADESLWTANFARGVQMKLEAVIARAIKEEMAEAEMLEEKADTFFQRARTHSSKQRSTTEPFVRSRLARSRFARRG